MKKIYEYILLPVLVVLGIYVESIIPIYSRYASKIHTYTKELTPTLSKILFATFLEYKIWIILFIIGMLISYIYKVKTFKWSMFYLIIFIPLELYLDSYTVSGVTGETWTFYLGKSIGLAIGSMFLLFGNILLKRLYKNQVR